MKSFRSFTTSSKQPIYFKVTDKKNQNPNLRNDFDHHNYQYLTGLNILEGKFNDNPRDPTGSGGFYFTTKERIRSYYHLGKKLRIVTLPTDDPRFKMVKFDYPYDHDYRSNMIILSEKYSLLDIDTYTKFGLNPKLSIHVYVQTNILERSLNLIFNFIIKYSTIAKLLQKYPILGRPFRKYGVVTDKKY